MFHFFRKNNRQPAQEWAKDFSFLHTDIHSHLIPGIDDGSTSIEDSLLFLEGLHQLGYRRIITTPHIKWERFKNTPATIQGGLSGIQNALQAKGLDLTISAAAEYFMDDHFMEILGKEPLLTLFENKLLVEYSFYAAPFMVQDTFFRIQTAGYQPVLAHPERYSYYHEKREVYRSFKDQGVLLQMNLLSITGYYGKKIQDIALWLLEEQLYDYCGTDLHHQHHLDAMQQLLSSKHLALLQAYGQFGNRQIPAINNTTGNTLAC